MQITDSGKTQEQTLVEKERQSRHIPWLFVAFFITFLILDAIFVYYAITTSNGTRTGASYDKSLNYDDTTALYRKFTEDGYVAGLKFEKSALDEGTLILTIENKISANLPEMKVKADIIRPVTDGYDFTLDFAFKGNGMYEAPVKFPLPGLWEAEFTLSGKEDYKLTRRVMIR